VTVHSRRRIGVGVALAVCLSGGLLLRAQLPQAAGTWTSIGDTPDSRVGAAAVVLPDGRTLIAGGIVDGAPTGAVVIYDPADGSFTSAGRLLERRVGHTATLLDDGRILVAGGTVSDLLNADLELFDPVSGASTLGATMAQLRSGHAAARLADGTVLIAGGAGPHGVLQTAEIYDPAAGSTTPTPAAMQTPRTGASATPLIDGRVLIAGGSDGSADLASAEIYDPSSHSFAPVETTFSVPRSGHAAVLLPHNNSVLIAGGASNGEPRRAADLFLPAELTASGSYGTGRFAPTGAMTAARSGAVGGPHVEGYAFVVGGGPSDEEVYRFATIRTDKDDYAPGETVVITGTGWQPGEEVTLLLQEVQHPLSHEDRTFTAVADANGNIFNSEFAPEEHDLGVRFYLTAFNSSGLVAQATFLDSHAPGSPSNLAATVDSASQITLTWSPSATGVVSEYHVSRRLDSAGSFIALGNTSLTTYVDSNLQCPRRFSYSVSAHNHTPPAQHSESTSNPAVDATIAACGPLSVSASGVSATRIDVAWVDQSTIETDFRIERSADGVGGWAEIGTTAGSSPPATVGGGFIFMDSSLSCGQTRYYRIRARKASPGETFSDYSATASASTPTCDNTPPSVTNVLATPNPANGSAAVVLTATATDALTNVASAEYNIDAGSFAAMPATDGTFDELTEDVTVTIAAATIAALTEGNHTLCVRASDTAANTSGNAAACTTLDVDKTPPVVTNVVATPNPANGTAAVVLTATATDALTNVASAEYNIDSGSFAAMQAADGAFDELVENVTVTIAAATIAGLSDGNHTLCVRASDTATNTSGNAAACTTLVVDKTPPVVTNVVATPNPANGSTGVVLTATATDALSNIALAEYNIDAASFALMQAADGIFDELAESVTITIAAATIAALTEGNHTLCVRATDVVVNTSAVTCTTLVVDKTAPVVSDVAATPNPVATGSSTVLSAKITDVLSNVVSAEYSTDGGTTWSAFSAFTPDDEVTVSKTIALPTGVYNLCVRGTDAAGNTSDGLACILLAVYDPTAGFVTGGGWIDSPLGAYYPDTSLAGKANFGFVAKYRRGANVPDGSTEFQFHAAGLKFHSRTYEWLVVAGERAQYKGVGNFNGTEGYGFMLTAIDGNKKPDAFRMKIWDPTGVVIYDNQLGASDTSEPTTTLGGGSIVIHAK
jgi:hypothetical protein